MNVLIVDSYRITKLISNTDNVPRVGDTISWRSNSYPKVREVVWYPSEHDLDNVGISDSVIHVIVLI